MFKLPIDPLKETTFRLRQAHAFLPGAPNYQRLYRAATRGKQMPDGTFIQLETILMSDGRHTSVEAWERWIKRISEYQLQESRT